jgi:HNH endonuclease
MRISDREFVAHRAYFCCEYCLSQHGLSNDDFAVEHIIAKAQGGGDALDNLAFACQGCNSRKYTAIEAIDPVSNTLVPLYHPRHDVWGNHFIWSDNFEEMIGLTPTGRATIGRLDLNRPRLVNLRRALRIAGEHPPSR